MEENPNTVRVARTVVDTGGAMGVYAWEWKIAAVCSIEEMGLTNAFDWLKTMTDVQQAKSDCFGFAAALHVGR